MAYENIHDVEQMLTEAVGNIDPADPKGRKRIRILDAASELFVAQGYRKTNVGEVARKAGIAKGTVYLYFKTKVDILVTVIALEKIKALTAFADIFDETIPAPIRLRKWIVQTLLITANSPLISRLLEGDEDMAAVLADMDPKLLARRNDGRALMGDLIHAVAPTHHLQPADIEARVDVLSSLAFIAPHLRAPHVRHGVPLEDFAKILADIIVTGIQKEGEP